MSPLLYALLLALAALAYWGMRRYLRALRQRFLSGYSFPPRLQKTVLARYPHLQEKQAREVIAALRQYFRLCQIAGRKNLAMPSQAVDVAWHEWIVFTQLYRRFCQRAFGRFLHHTPAEAMASAKSAQQGIRNTWKLACKLENINPRTPQRLPTLFALDAALAIPDGFHYQLNCTPGARNANGSPVYCGSHIGCASGIGCGSGCGSSCGSGCGGGD